MDLQDQVVNDRYVVGPLLGEGGDALVYRAQDRALGRVVALKLLRPELRADPTFVERFEREARGAGRLSHPHIVSVYDYGEALGTYFLVMEYVPGGDLRARLQGGRALPLAMTLRLGAEVAEALGAAHALGIVHRDVKPANILLDDDGQAKVTDFGIAKMLDVPALTAPAALLGTPHYLAPEQATGAPITPATDVYALGVVLYEVLAGRRPFEGESFVHVAMQHLHAEPRPLTEWNPAVPSDVAALVARALAKEPAARFADGTALAAALDAQARMLGLPVRARLAQAGRRVGGRAASPAREDRTESAVSPARETEAAAPLARPPEPAVVGEAASTGAALRAPASRPWPTAEPARASAPVHGAAARAAPVRSSMVDAERPRARWGQAGAGPDAATPGAGRRVEWGVPVPAGRLRARTYPRRRDPQTTAALVAVVAGMLLVGVMGGRAVLGGASPAPEPVTQAVTPAPAPRDEMPSRTAPPPLDTPTPAPAATAVPATPTAAAVTREPPEEAPPAAAASVVDAAPRAEPPAPEPAPAAPVAPPAPASVVAAVAVEPAPAPVREAPAPARVADEARASAAPAPAATPPEPEPPAAPAPQPAPPARQGPAQAAPALQPPYAPVGPVPYPPYWAPFPPGPVPPVAGRPMPLPPGVMPPGMVPPGMIPPGMVPPGMVPPGMVPVMPGYPAPQQVAPGRGHDRQR